MVAAIEGSPNGGTGDCHLLPALRTIRRSVEGFGGWMSSELFIRMAVRHSPSGQISVHFGGILYASWVIRRAMGKWIPPVNPLVRSCIHGGGRIQSKGRMVVIPNLIVRITGRSNQCLRSISFSMAKCIFSLRLWKHRHQPNLEEENLSGSSCRHSLLHALNHPQQRCPNFPFPRAPKADSCFDFSTYPCVGAIRLVAVSNIRRGATKGWT